MNVRSHPPPLCEYSWFVTGWHNHMMMLDFAYYTCVQFKSSRWMLEHPVFHLASCNYGLNNMSICRRRGLKVFTAGCKWSRFGKFLCHLVAPFFCSLHHLLISVTLYFNGTPTNSYRMTDTSKHIKITLSHTWNTPVCIQSERLPFSTDPGHRVWAVKHHVDQVNDSILSSSTYQAVHCLLLSFVVLFHVRDNATINRVHSRLWFLIVKCLGTLVRLVRT